MGPWRLELVRLWRTRRAVALVATFVILGLGIPVLTYYLPDLVKHAGNGVRIIAPRQTPADAIEGFASNAAQLGTLVVAIITASSVAIDAHPVLAAFYRTRVERPAFLLLPRYLTVTAASVAALALGTLGAWYETEILLGRVGAGALLGGLALQSLWICFATSTVTLATTTTRSIAAAVGATIAVLLALALLGNLSSTSSWVPTRLSASSADLLRHQTAGVWHAILVTTLATITALALAIDRLGKREPHPAGSYADG
jgi:ABC-2 type transport system permease protein